MHILLTGSTGYIGRRLLPILVNEGHIVTCLVRDERRFDFEDFDDDFLENVNVVEADLTDRNSLENLPKEIDVAYYFVHGMSTSHTDFSDLEKKMVTNFSDYISKTDAEQIIYLSGIANDEDLSDHLQSRKDTEDILKESGVPLTTLRAAIIIGSGSASFEIIRDLVEKLPVMVAPKWLMSKCQPISIRNVIQYLNGVILKEETYNKSFDIGGPDILTYKEMLLTFAKVRGLNRKIFTVPVLTTKLSSYWLYFVTSTSYNLARSLVESMHNDAITSENNIRNIIDTDLITYKDALNNAFQKIQQNEVISSWKDTINGPVKEDFLDFIKVPTYGCLTDEREYRFEKDPDKVTDNIWRIGGERGWYYGTWLWGLRGFLDQLAGGVGLRRGRRDSYDLKAGDALDFWRVIKADKKKRNLLLYAEMKLPGDAWLEFKINEDEKGYKLKQKATFRPHGLLGRAYWYSVLPFHFFIFPGMAKNIIKYDDGN